MHFIRSINGEESWSKVLEYVLDQNRPPGELLVKEGNTCLTREDFWSLGLAQCMESTIGNACLKIVGEAAKRHGKDVHIADLYAVATWKDQQVDLSKDILLFPAWSRQAGGTDHYLLCGLSSLRTFFFFCPCLNIMSELVKGLFLFYSTLSASAPRLR
uniref:Uncharacterized protein n=1 Tax=Salarias fasciatus TaxID=181472 RepID=A0A672GMW7_SALFA